jgi:hypothetical protein
MNVYWGSSGIVPLILREKGLHFPLNRRQGRPQVQSRHHGEETKTCLWRRSSRDYFVVRPYPSHCTDYAIPDTLVTLQQYPISVCSAKWEWLRIWCLRGLRYQGSGGDYITRSLWYVLLIKYYSVDQIKKTEIRGASGKCGEEEGCIEGYGGENLRDLNWEEETTWKTQA